MVYTLHETIIWRWKSKKEGMEWTIELEWLRWKNYSKKWLEKMSKRRHDLGETEVDGGIILN